MANISLRICVKSYLLQLPVSLAIFVEFFGEIEIIVTQKSEKTLSFHGGKKGRRLRRKEKKIFTGTVYKEDYISQNLIQMTSLDNQSDCQISHLMPLDWLHKF